MYENIEAELHENFINTFSKKVSPNYVLVLTNTQYKNM